ncbi:MAG: ABC transporter ATP-binding protein [Candidatus Comchoanobacterales bacterium]
MVAVNIKGLEKTYHNGVSALKGVDLEIKEGSFFCLLGLNGAGKTTMIGCITSLVRKTKGIIEIFGYDTEKQPNYAKQMMGVMPQEINFHPFLNIRQALIDQAGLYGIRRKDCQQRVDELLEIMKLTQKSDKIVQSLSGGMKRRLMLARALVHNPKLLILDEPTAGVDIDIRKDIWTYLRDLNQAGTTIILTTHYLEEAENLCNEVAVLNNGMIVESGPMNTIKNSFNHITYEIHCNAMPQNLDLKQWNLTPTGDTQFKVTLQDERDFTLLISLLHEEKIIIKKVDNCSNQLETFFLDTIEEKK